MEFNVPEDVSIRDDLVVFLVPQLRWEIESLLGQMNEGALDAQVVNWGFSALGKNRYSAILRVSQGGHSLKIDLPWTMWELLPQIQRAGAVGLVAHRYFFRGPDGEPVPMYFRQTPRWRQGPLYVLRHTMYPIPSAGAAMHGLKEQVEAIVPSWNPKGVLTYLLDLLEGERGGIRPHRHEGQ